MLEMGVVQRHRPDFVRQHNERRAVRPVGEEPASLFQGRLPRLTRLMALAVRFDHLLASGAIQDQTELAELGHVTRARVTQIMNLLHLAPDIQEAILSLPPTIAGRDPLHERDIRHIVAQPEWNRQRRLWTEFCSKLSIDSGVFRV
jgi:hypothetical protein